MSRLRPSSFGLGKRHLQWWVPSSFGGPAPANVRQEINRLAQRRRAWPSHQRPPFVAIVERLQLSELIDVRFRAIGQVQEQAFPRSIRPVVCARHLGLSKEGSACAARQPRRKHRWAAAAGLQEPCEPPLAGGMDRRTGSPPPPFSFFHLPLTALDPFTIQLSMQPSGRNTKRDAERLGTCWNKLASCCI